MSSDRSLADAESAVTPVVGTLLIIAITIVGMATIMIWGAPTIEGLRLGNAQDTLVAEFEQIRVDAHVLSVEDSSRLPVINVPSGELLLEQGTRMMVSYVNSDATGLPGDCDQLVIAGWNDATPTTLTIDADSGATCTIDDTAAGCAADGCVRIYEVRGGSLIEQTVSYVGGVATVTGADFTSRDEDWLIRITSDATTSPVVFAEAWIISGDRLAWRQDSSVGTYGAFYDSGAIFSQRSLAIFQEKRPFVQEQHFGEAVYFFRLDTLDASGDYGGITASDSFQVFLGLQSMHTRTDASAVPELRFTFQGELAESWCESLLIRNSFIDPSPGYVADATFSCATGNSEGLRSITYSEGADFPFQFIHANIRTVIQL